MRKFSRDRRRLLKNSIKTAAALPFLQHLPSLAASSQAQKRFIMLFTPNGTIPEEFFPTGSENQFEFNRILAPLTSLKSEINVYKGLDNKLPNLAIIINAVSVVYGRQANYCLAIRPMQMVAIQ